MLSLCIRAESQKLRRSPIWLACFLLPLIPALYGTYNYLQNTGILTGKWYSLWSQLTLFYAIFFY
ncbi:MAG: ABC transporter permease, partial [Roseburia sp.]|nr:ABC transporter permease [Roseburia sp.]